MHWGFMRQSLLFIAGLAGLFSIVPLATWAATGSWRRALEAARGYGALWLAMGGLAAVGAVIGLIAAALTP
jgi:hypothetical protein